VGQKVNPNGMRIGIIKGWDSNWYADKDYEKFLLEDIKIREFIKEKLFLSGISKVEIERASNKVSISIHTGKPGMVIGRQGSNIELLKGDLKKMTSGNIDINIVEVKQPDMDATLVAESIASQLERRIAFRRAMKQALGRTMRMGALGIKIQCGGRLGGAEIARSESVREGSIPLHTLRANIDYGTAEAHTTYGRIGVKVWIYKGEVLPKSKQVETAKPAAKSVAKPAAKSAAKSAAAKEA
jgi:small subunit ribosomal protein S3